MAKRDLYEILGVPKTASADEIKRAHRKLVRQYHPDVNKNDKSSETKFKEAQEAYDVLSDEQKRKAYDQFGHAGVNGGGGDGPDPFAGFGRGRPGGGRGPAGGGPGGFDPSEFSNAADLGDIFEQFFGRGGATAGGGPRATRGGGGRTRVRPEPVPPPPDLDVEQTVTLTFEQAARGATLPLQISRDGKLETIEVKIPPGVDKVRLRGRGRQASDGSSGDLYIKVGTVREHDAFRRDGLDVVMDVPVSVYEALLGTKVTVPTLDGPVTISIPPGTNSGAKLRIKGRGAFRGDDKGDQLCAIKILVPKPLDDEDKELVAKLQAKHPVDARPGW
jgi:curved DNA-binding protein